jgi:OPA family sugar phosphate sensor protein UhpC-like MFS transporter
MSAALDARTRDWRTRVFVSTWVCYVTYYFCRKPFSVGKSSIGKELGLDATELGDIGAVYLITYAIGQFMAGVLGQRLGQRTTLLTGMACSAAVSLAFGLVPSSPVFWVGLGINGLAQATGWSGNVGIMARWFGHHERGRVMGTWATCFTVGSITSTWFAGWVLGQWGWRAAFLAGVVVLVLSMIVTAAWSRLPERLRLQPIPPGEEGGEPDPAGAAAAEERRPGPLGLSREAWGAVLLVGGFYFFAKLVRYAIWSWVPFFLQRNYQLTGDAAAYYSTAFDLAGIPGVWFTGWMSDRFFGSRRAMPALIMVIAMTVATGALLGLGGVGVGVFALLLALVGFSLYGPDALLTGAGAMDIGRGRQATLAAGLISGIGSIGPIVQELVIGRLYDAKGGELGPVFALLFGSSIMSALFCVALVRRGRRAREV